MQGMKEKELEIKRKEIQAWNKKMAMKLINTDTNKYSPEKLAIHNKLLEDTLLKIFK